MPEVPHPESFPSAPAVTAEKPIRYGILSVASTFSRFTAAMNETGTGIVTAVSSRSLHKAEEAASKWNIPFACTDYREILNSPEIDAVYIPVINSLHYSYARDALLAGKHVILEKPFVLHAGQAQELFDLAEERGLFLTEAIKTPFLPVYAYIKQLIAERELGAIRFMEFHQSYTGGSYIAGWNRDRESGGGVLYANEAYFFRMAEFFGGTVRSCTGTASFGESGVEEQVSLSVQLENGCLASLGVSTNILFDNALRIFLDHGTVIVPDYWKADRCFLYQNRTLTEEKHFPCEHEFRYELAHYNDCIRSSLSFSPVNSPDRTIRYIGICEALYRTWEKEAGTEN